MSTQKEKDAEEKFKAGLSKNYENLVEGES